jgi:hypothetical protein
VKLSRCRRQLLVPLERVQVLEPVSPLAQELE